MKIEALQSLLEANIFFNILHSALMRILIKLKSTVKLTARITDMPQGFQIYS